MANNTVTPAKIRVSAKSIPILIELDRAVKQQRYRGPDAMLQVASDTLDGGYYRKELQDLIKRRLLSVVRYGRGEVHPAMRENPRLCGTTWSVDVTPRLIAALWPDRIGGARP